MLATSTIQKTQLDPRMKASDVMEFESELHHKIVGQDEAIRQLVEIYQVCKAGLAMPGRPIANLLFLGPTGTGKTRLVEAAAEILSGDPRGFIKIDCAEFQHSHEIAKLVGSPPGYIGHKETSPAITQEVIEAFKTKNGGFTFVLFDEIEKASEALWQLLLGILDKATLKLGDNRVVDFSRTIICMTSNLGARQLDELISGTIGFVAGTAAQEKTGSMKQKMYHVSLEAAKRHFSPEFMNRLDRVIVFKSLTPKDLDAILDIELSAVQNRIFAAGAKPFVLKCSRRARQLLLREGTDAAYGARHLKRSIERNLVLPLSNLIATGQTDSAAAVQVDMRSGHLVFSKLDFGTWTNAPASDRALQHAFAV